MNCIGGLPYRPYMVQLHALKDEISLVVGE
jgi:hypothetical protein